MCQCGEGDELCGQEESFKAWLRECYLVKITSKPLSILLSRCAVHCINFSYSSLQHSCEVYSLDPRMSEDEALQVQPKVARDSYRVSIYTGSEARKGVCQGMTQMLMSPISHCSCLQACLLCMERKCILLV